jgi:hypothetical protein
MVRSKPEGAWVATLARKAAEAANTAEAAKAAVPHTAEDVAASDISEAVPRTAPAVHFTVLSATPLWGPDAWAHTQAGICTGLPALAPLGGAAPGLAHSPAAAEDHTDARSTGDVATFAGAEASLIDVVPVGNPGRAQECPGILTFIIENYDNLPDLMVRV